MEVIIFESMFVQSEKYQHTELCFELVLTSHQKYYLEMKLFLLLSSLDIAVSLSYLHTRRGVMEYWLAH